VKEGKLSISKVHLRSVLQNSKIDSLLTNFDPFNKGKKSTIYFGLNEVEMQRLRYS